MRKIPFHHRDFYANYFWSLRDGTPIPESRLVKTYLGQFFTFTDLVKLHQLVGRDALLKYAKELTIEDRIKKLLDLIKKYQ